MIEIDSKLPVNEATQRLRHLLANMKDSTGQFSVLSGHVTDSHLDMIRTERLANSVFRPQFAATLRRTESGTRLVGDFILSGKARSIVRVSFASVGVWLILSIIVAASSGQPILWYLPVVGGLVLVLGLLFLRFARTYYRDDEDWILRLIAENLRGVVRRNSSTQQE